MDVAQWNLELYGLDVNKNGSYDASADFPLKTTLESLITDEKGAAAGDYGVTIQPYRLNPNPEYEGDETEASNGHTTGLKVMRYVFECSLRLKDFPSVRISIKDFYNIPVFSARYHWIWFDDYELSPEDETGVVIPNTKVYPVAIFGFGVDHSDAPAKKAVIFKFKGQEIHLNG